MSEQEPRELLADAKKAYYKAYREKNATKIKAHRERFFYNQMIRELRSFDLAEIENSEQG